MTENDVKALVFDVFGTVVDYRSTIINEGAELNRAKNLTIDWARFADEWRGRYRPSMARVARGELPWTNLDTLHRRSLDELLVEFGISDAFDEAEKDRLNRVWHRLIPWPDAVAGLTRLKQKYIIATLSNGNVALLVNMAKFGSLPWDCILSAELAKAYKPDPRAYLMAAELLGLKPAQVMLVAAHVDDLLAAQAQGLKTAFVYRPLEWVPTPEHPAENPKPEDKLDFIASDFIDLAQQLGL